MPTIPKSKPISYTEPYHYWDLTVKKRIDLGDTVDQNYPVTGGRMIRGTAFDDSFDFENEDYQGHTGTRGLNLQKDRTDVTTEPEYEHGVVFGEGLEGVFYLLLGGRDKVSGVAVNPANVTKEGQTSTKAYKHHYFQEVTNPTGLPTATLCNGYSMTAYDASVYDEAKLDELEISFDDKGVTSKVKFVSYAPYENQPNQTKNIAPGLYKLEKGDIKISIAPPKEELTVADINARITKELNATIKARNKKIIDAYMAENEGTTESDVPSELLEEEWDLLTGQATDNVDIRTISSELRQALFSYDCVMSNTITFRNNLDKANCLNTPFGQVVADEGDFEVEGELEIKWNLRSRHLESEWKTGDKFGTNVTANSLFKQVYFECVGSEIEKVNNVSFNRELDIYLPKVEITKALSDKSGDERKTLNVEFEAVTTGDNGNSVSAVDVIIITDANDLPFGEKLPIVTDDTAKIAYEESILYPELATSP